MPVEIIFVADGVEIPDASGWIAQQRVRELIEGTNLRLISEAANLKS